MIMSKKVNESYDLWCDNIISPYPLLIFILHEYNRINAVGHDG